GSRLWNGKRLHEVGYGSGGKRGEEEQCIQTCEGEKFRICPLLVLKTNTNAVVLEDDKEEDKDVVDAVKDVEKAKVDESAQVDKTEPAKVQEVVDVITTAKLIIEVITAASETVIAASAIITTAEAQVPAATTTTLTVAPVRVVAAPSRRRK
nr:hypothetical protein [Tanacetum cinerariifolium]